MRDATRDAHDRVDALFARFDLSDAVSYAAFLAAHAQALLPIEAALDAAGAGQLLSDWAARKRGDLLLADLAAHDGAIPSAPPFPLAADDATLAGVIYVVEGSRLGGLHLARRVGPAFSKSYLDRGQAPGKWSILLDRIDALLYDPARMRRATASALDAFAAFEAAGRTWLPKA